jgi:hypothetical protein
MLVQTFVSRGLDHDESRDIEAGAGILSALLIVSSELRMAWAFALCGKVSMMLPEAFHFASRSLVLEVPLRRLSAASMASFI